MRCAKCKKEQKKIKTGLVVFKGLTERPTQVRVCDGCGWPIFEYGVKNVQEKE